MERRRFLSGFMQALAGVTTVAVPAARVNAVVASAGEHPTEIPPGYVKLRCQVEFWPNAYGPGQHRPACGAEFLVSRGAGGYPVCPHCGSAQDTSRGDARNAALGILVKEGDPRWKLDWAELDRQRQLHA